MIQPIVDAIRLACAFCEDVQQDVQGINKFSSIKNSSEPVTVGDYGAQALLGRALMKHFPNDGVVAEESGEQFATIVSFPQQQDVVRRLSNLLSETVTIEDVVRWLDFGKDKQAARTWVIDPIDGTKGFIAHRHYAICIGYLENSIPSGGVMGCPYYNEGQGAIFFTDNGKLYRDSVTGGNVLQVGVSQRQHPADWIAVQSFEDSKIGRKDGELVLDELSWGNQVTLKSIDSMEKYALVACGDADMMIRLPNLTRTSPHMIWDHVAGIALVLAGGGVATDYDGQPLDFSQGKSLPNKGMMVTSGVMHKELVEAALRVKQR
jgi:3'(2'), 5'-bisphosphate nucleotidase